MGSSVSATGGQRALIPNVLCGAHAGSLLEVAREIASGSTRAPAVMGSTDEQNLRYWSERIGVARPLLGGPELLREQRGASLQSRDLAS